MAFNSDSFTQYSQVKLAARKHKVEVEARREEVCFEQETYGSCDIERENISGTGWFTEDPTEIQEKWVTLSL